MKPLSLSVHKNTLGQRERHRVSHSLKDAARRLAGDGGIVGYAIIAWDADWNANAFWETGRIMPAMILPEFTKEVLTATMLRTALDNG